MRAQLLTGLLVVAATTGAVAQDAEPSREVRRLERDLGLTADQVKELTRIYAEREEAVKKLLTEAQRQQYEQRQTRGAQGGWGGGPGGMGGMGGFGGMAGMMQGLRDELGLTEEQTKKADEMQAELRKKAEDMMAKARETGDWSAMRELGGIMQEGMTRFREILTPEQQTKLDARMADFGGRFGGMGGGNRGGRGQGGESRGIDRRLQRVKDDLKLTEEEELVLLPKIKEALEASEKGDEAVRKAREGVRDVARDLAAPAEKLPAAIETLRKTQADARAKLETIRTDLRSLVTRGQEAILVGHGVLD